MKNQSILLNLLNAGPQQDEMQKFNQFLSSINKELYNKPFFNDCQICRKVKPKFCNSHTIPRFILKNIADNGRIYNTQILKENPFMQPENGIENAQTFKSICCECDSKIFQEYETPENWLTPPNNTMLNQIALKCHLYYQYKLTRDIRRLDYVNTQISEKYKIKKNKTPLNNIIKPWSLDKKAHARKVKTLYSQIDKNEEIFKLGYYRKLDYVIPLVFQGTFAIHFDIQGRKINNPFSKKIDGLRNIYLCLYPFQDSSIIVIFYESNKYDKFFKELNGLDLEEQLSIINFLVFANSEDVFISKNVDMSVFDNDDFKQIAFVQPISITVGNNKNDLPKTRLEAFRDEFNISNHKKCPNLLSRKFAI